MTRGHRAASLTQGLSYPWVCRPAQPRLLPVYQALLPDEPLALLSGNASMEPGLGAVDGWSWERQKDSHSPLATPTRNAQRSYGSPPSPAPGTLGVHPPALRLVPEPGVGRLRRWFFCRAVGDTGDQGVTGALPGTSRIQSPFLYL